MTDLNTILAAAYRDGTTAAQSDYTGGVLSDSPLSGEFEGGRLTQDIANGYPEAVDVAVALAIEFGTKVADEVETIGEAIVDSWSEGYASFDPITDWLDNEDEDDYEVI